MRTWASASAMVASGPRITGSEVIIAPAVFSTYDISRLTSSASSGSISWSRISAVSGGSSAIRSAASSGSISSRTSAARSLSSWPMISTWSSSGSSSRTSASRSSVRAATTAVRRSNGRSWITLAASAGPELVERVDELGGALGRLAPGQPLDLAPLHDVGLAAPAQRLGGLLDRDPAQHPVAVAGLLHGDVVDGAGHARRRHGDHAVEQLADDQRLGRPLLEAAHVQQPGRVDLPAVDVGHPGHRHEDPPATEHLGHHPEHARLADLGPEGHHEVAHLADLVALGVEDRQSDEPRGVHAGRAGAHMGERYSGALPGWAHDAASTSVWSCTSGCPRPGRRTCRPCWPTTATRCARPASSTRS